ncbi:MAG: diphthine synthase [Candidatus ainarchaeum sp.]|jgi:diphthine synthase|nr:diphthine synthase [Candidatus ainarchaeum sp.]MDD4128421.1 diphthine synthase [Candidatus ainarchaeum sp.]HPM85494.1 diphthine synthase [archaeon]
MLYLIGLGLKPSHLTLEAIETIKSCDSLFVEVYTSQYAEGFIKELKELTGKNIMELNRIEIEQNFESALISANKNKIGLLIFGNPLTATTHIQVLLDAKEKGIKYKIIPGISITNMIAESGLDEYKFGRTITICYHILGFEPESFYDQLKENQKMGLHTLALLDIKKDQTPPKMMNSREAINILEKIAEKRGEHNNFKYIALIGMGSEKQKIIVGREEIINSKEIYELFPQTLIIAGKMNEKEKEVLEKLHNKKFE